MGVGEELMGRYTALRTDQRGVSGVETATALIAFVVVASMFAWAIISSGLNRSEKSQESVFEAVEESAASMRVRGGVVANANAALTAVDTIKFKIGSASRPLVEVSDTAMILTYGDEDQALNIAASDWTATWLTGSGVILDPGETVEIRVTLTGLSPRLGRSKEFIIRVKPQTGHVLSINRTMPLELFRYMDLN